MLQKSVSLDRGSNELTQAPERTFATSGTRPRGVAPAEIRASLLTLEPVVLPRPAKFRDVTRWQLMAAGCAAALAGYGLTAWGSELYTAQASALNLPQRVESAPAEAYRPIDAIIALNAALPASKPVRGRRAAGASSQPTAAARIVARTASTPVEAPALSEPPAAVASDAIEAPAQITATPEAAEPPVLAEIVAPPPAAAPSREVEAPRPQPSAAAAVPVRVQLRELSVRGSLPSSAVRHGLERLQPQLARCTEPCAALGCAPSRWHTELAIDEAGRTRQPRVSGPASADIARCLEKAASKLATSAPDTGTVRVSWDLELQR